MTRINVSWTRALPTAAIVVSLVSISACSRSDAQQTAAQTCTAAVTFVSAAGSCPTAAFNFHVSVTGCSSSTGTFGYSYLKGNANQRINSQGSGTWIRSVSEWDQTEKIAVNCDQEIHDVQTDKTASCTCSSP